MSFGGHDPPVDGFADLRALGAIMKDHGLKVDFVRGRERTIYASGKTKEVEALQAEMYAICALSDSIDIDSPNYLEVTAEIARRKHELYKRIKFALTFRNYQKGEVYAMPTDIIWK